MTKIVIGFDGTSESRDALHLGNAFAHAMDAELIVATALNPRIDLSGSEAEHFVSIFNQARHELPHRDFAMRELRAVSAPAGLSDTAATEEAELIIIGSTHRGKLGRALPGSVSERLLSRAPCAVVVAPRGFARVEHFGLGLIGVAFDGSLESELALQRASALAGRLDASLRVITIVPTMGTDSTKPMSEVLHDHGRDVRDRALSELPPWVEVESALEDGDPAAALARHGVDLDLLVIGSRGYGPVRRTLLGGVSADVMRTAPCPVVVVPRTAAPMPDEGLVEVNHGHGTW
jgi:nucleotide-binding universal stress UspA family protein